METDGAEYWGISNGGGGRPSVLVGGGLPRTREFSDGEKIPRLGANGCGAAADCTPYDPRFVLGGGQMLPPTGVKGGRGA